MQLNHRIAELHMNFILLNDIIDKQNQIKVLEKA